MLRFTDSQLLHAYNMQKEKVVELWKTTVRLSSPGSSKKKHAMARQDAFLAAENLSVLREEILRRGIRQ